MSRSLQILLVTPAPARSRTGNRVTALRVAGMLRSLGHRVRVREGDDARPADLMLAVHARKSAAAVAAFAARCPRAPVVVLLAGTDLYPRLDDHPDAVATVELAARLVALQPLAAAELPARHRGKVRVVLQSATPLPAVARDEDKFDVCVLAHLRQVKDPLLVVRALELLPAKLPVRVRHAGGVVEEELGAQARAVADPRYCWLGPLPRAQARVLLASSRLLVIASHNEGGANVLSEAIAGSVPVLATDVPGNTGILGADHPGLFPPGDAAALAALLERAVRDSGFLGLLEEKSRALQPLVQPAREREAWARLLGELGPGRIAAT